MTTVLARVAVLTTAGALATAGLIATATASSATSGPRCGNGSLTVTRTFVEGGAGHSWLVLIYRNATKHTCTVSGYPGLDAISSKGQVLAHAARTRSGYGGGGKLGTVTIRPAGYASASVEWLNFNGRTGGACRFSAAVNTIVANTSRVHRLAVSVSVCGLQVHPTIAGTGQYPHYGPAQQYWIEGAKVVSARMNYYFLKAEHELKVAKIYPTQVKQLAQLISLPETGLTPKQIKAARADVKALNSFFDTPGLYA
jgi:Protein of unknown function (DUF4232)